LPGFLNLFRQNSRTTPQIRPRPFPSESILIHYSPIIPTFDAVNRVTDRSCRISGSWNSWPISLSRNMMQWWLTWKLAGAVSFLTRTSSPTPAWRAVIRVKEQRISCGTT
jgi:hypothetical protein